MIEIRRRLYKRGSSFETTLPMPIAFSLDDSKKYKMIFKFDPKSQKWYIEFEDVNSS